MRIKDEAQFAIGVIIVLMAITCTTIFAYYHTINIRVLLLVSITFAYGILRVLANIETKAQKQSVKQSDIIE